MADKFLIAALLVVAVPVILFTFLLVHRGLNGLCIRHAQRYCRRNGLEIQRMRWRPEFESTGIKTEATLIQLDCLDAQLQRRLVSLTVWPFGVRKTLSDELYREQADDPWPEDEA